MGKRKKSSQHGNLDLPSSSDDLPCSSGMQLVSKEHSPNSGAGIDVRDSSVKLLNSSPSVAQRHHDPGHSMLSKRSRHHYGHHYSRRNPGSLAGKISSLRDEKISKFTQYNPETGHFADGWEKAFGRPERIKSSSSAMDAVSPYKAKMICSICQKHLRRKPHFLGNTSASDESSVVAVLVCGHLYHADCLEERTNVEYRHDPLCPLCSSSPPQV